MTTESKITSPEEYAKLRLEPSQASDQAEQKYIEGTEAVWICEFCMAHNSVPKDFVIAPGNNPCYIVEQGKIKAMEQEESEQMLIFCIDVSGSMEMEVKGNKNRLDCVVEAIVDELKKLRIERSTKKVGIVWFGGEVTILGDASQKE